MEFDVTTDLAQQDTGAEVTKGTIAAGNWLRKKSVAAVWNHHCIFAFLRLNVRPGRHKLITFATIGILPLTS